MTTLTDYENFSLPLPFDLANGHAYQEFSPLIADILSNLKGIWETGCSKTPTTLERDLRRSFATLIGSTGLASIDKCLISPSASNSIDIIGAYVASEGIETLLIEPTFDNLALLFERRGAKLLPLVEDSFITAIENRSLHSIFSQAPSVRALFIINPNNPTGHTMDEAGFKYLCQECLRNNVTLIVDNSFRMFNRNMFDDYAILLESGVNFISFEDTGKCWPTLDLKLSMMFSSDDHFAKLQEIYRELYLGPSLFAVSLFTEIFERTYQTGIKDVIWNLIDSRRTQLREALRSSSLVPLMSRNWSPLPVEWIRVSGMDKIDLDVCEEFAQEGLGILPGRHFFWSSVSTAPVDNFIRISLLKPSIEFAGGLSVLDQVVGARLENIVGG